MPNLSHCPCCSPQRTSFCLYVFLLTITLLGQTSAVHAQLTGAYPHSHLTVGSDGNFYGTAYGGSSGYGIVFKLSSTGALTSLHTFGGASDGAFPFAALTQGKDGNLYGTTEYGGVNGYGTVFKLTTAGVLTTLHSFNGDDGVYPSNALIQGSDGNLYGTTIYGGIDDTGTVFKITPAGVFTTLYTFSPYYLNDSDINQDGANPTALIQGSDGNFYAATSTGGTYGYGTLFKITSTGTLTTLHDFYSFDGSVPTAPLVLGRDGNFYGTTSQGGQHYHSAGTVFKLTSSGALTTLYSFTPLQGLTSAGCGTNTDGANPVAGITIGSDGNFYGITRNGGKYGNGTFYKITPAGTLTPLYAIGSGSKPMSNTFSSLALGKDNNFYLTSPSDGVYGNGSVYQLTSTGTVQLFYSLGMSYGALPVSGLIQGKDGNFYGTNQYGGANGSGTIFKITASGALTILHSFTALSSSNYTNTDGALPYCALVQGKDGNFYGTTNYGGANGYGTVFKITPSGTLTTLYSFTALNSSRFNADGWFSGGALVQGKDGNFYGTNQSGGANGNGTIFKITPSGTLTTLYSFSPFSNNQEGYYPTGALVQGADGNFYGTATYGGANGCGTVFKITPSGTLTYYTFGPNSGVGPNGGLILGKDGNFYGVAAGGSGISGGAQFYSWGSIFKLSPAGVLTKLYSFSYPVGGRGSDPRIGVNNDGTTPAGPLTQGADGNFYGTASHGGPYGALNSQGFQVDYGTFFKVTPAGTLTVLYAFGSEIDPSGNPTIVDPDGANPVAGVALGVDGNFYGITQNGSINEAGSIFKLTSSGDLTTLMSFINSQQNGF